MSEQDIAYGGQAVIGGVMIQSPKGWSLGIRDKNDKLHKYYEERIPLIKRNKFWSAPLIRGFGALIDSMYVGFKAITLSDQIYSDFEEYEERLVIGWKATRSWSQIAGNSPKPILALLKEYEEPEFPGFDEFKMMSNFRSSLPETWKAILSANKGIYLLVHEETGNQYIGSAYGEDGFFGRWANYEDELKGNGGNKLLKKLKKTLYQISILEVCHPTFSDEEVINRESKWKNKLGSRVFGLNAN